MSQKPDILILQDGSRLVECPKHGWTPVIAEIGMDAPGETCVKCTREDLDRLDQVDPIKLEGRVRRAGFEGRKPVYEQRAKVDLAKAKMEFEGLGDIFDILFK